MTRSVYVDAKGLRKGPWSKEEDDKLRAYIERYGHWNWREIPRFAGLSRCGKSCRLRWMNYLRPNIKHGNFTQKEEDLIMEMHNNIGSKWAKIAAELSGRSDNEIKNYWNTHLKKRAKIDQNGSKNMYLEIKNQTNFIDDLVENSDFGDHDHNEVEALWGSSSSLKVSLASTHESPCVTISSSPSSSTTLTSCSSSVKVLSSIFMASDSSVSRGDSIETYNNEYDDGSFWTDPCFADLDVVNNVIMSQVDNDEFMWSTMDLYSQYQSKFMI